MIQAICCSSLLSVPGRAGAFSRDFTTSLVPECSAFSGALKIGKLKTPLIPGPEGAVDTHDWCIKCERLGLKEEKTKLKEVHISRSSAYHSSCCLVSDNGVFKGDFTNGTREV